MKYTICGNLLYKAEMTSVRLSDRHVDSSVVYAWIDADLVYVELCYLACECMF